MIKRGWTVNRSRKTAMLICALAVVADRFCRQGFSLWLAVVLIGLAAAGHQGWSANIFTMASRHFFPGVRLVRSLGWVECWFHWRPCSFLN